MLKNKLAFILVAACVLQTALSLDSMDNYVELVTKILPGNPFFVQKFDQYVKELKTIEPNYFNYNPFDTILKAFTCEKESDSTVPTSVHRLRPQDIKVVGALGDSLTAALGAKADTIVGLTTENRGVSWSMGGDNALESVLTMPNILRKFNPSLYGFNTGFSIYPTNKDGVGFNAAVSGSKAYHMPEQAQRLVDRIKASSQVNLANDWKMITLFIGGNDLCDYCKNKTLFTPQNYINYIQTALDILHQNLPRTFVNLVTVLRVSEVKDLNLNLVCKTLHSNVCPCGAYPENAQEEAELVSIQTQYQSLIEDLVKTKRYEKSDFTVVVQPFLKQFSIPRLPNGDVDISFFAPDCFHLSQKGHAFAAVGLWNNLLQPVGSKQTSTDPYSSNINCPSASSPYFYTSENSPKL